MKDREMILEVPPRFELGMEVLQTSGTDTDVQGVASHDATLSHGGARSETGSNESSERERSALPERIAKRIAVTAEGCWLWTGARAANGYGAVKWQGRTRSAHRTVYELLVGPVPAGLELDHTCCARACVNPEHIEAVTPSENAQRVGRRGRRRDVGRPFIGPRRNWIDEPIVPRTTPRSGDA